MSAPNYTRQVWHITKHLRLYLLSHITKLNDIVSLSRHTIDFKYGNVSVLLMCLFVLMLQRNNSRPNSISRINNCRDRKLLFVKLNVFTRNILFAIITYFN